MLSPTFEFVLGHADTWPETRRRVAKSYVLQGRSLRETASHLRLTLHEVRTHTAVIDALADQHAAEPAR